MAKKPNKSEVVRVEPTRVDVQSNTPPSSQVHMIPDPNTGEQIPVIYDANSGQYVPVQITPQPPIPVAPADPSRRPSEVLSGNALGKRRWRRTREIIDPSGRVTREIEEDEAEVTGRTVSDETQQAMYSARDIPNAMSKKRLFIGGVLAIFVLMILADVVGVPHVRTGQGEYASLEGTKMVSDPDAPLVILKRLDRSVFLYTLDGLGWVFSTLGGGGENNEDK